MNAEVHVSLTRGAFIRKDLVLATQLADNVVWFTGSTVHTAKVIRSWQFEPFFKLMQVEHKEDAPCVPLCLTLGVNDYPFVDVPAEAKLGCPILDDNGLVGMVYAEGKGYMFSAQELLRLMQWHMRQRS